LMNGSRAMLRSFSHLPLPIGGLNKFGCLAVWLLELDYPLIINYQII
jgi:hypothetical protein